MEGLSDTIVTIILFIMSFGAAAGFFMIANSITTAKPITVEEISASCVNNTAYFVIRNGGTAPLAKSAFVCTKKDSGCSGKCVVDNNFPVGGAGYVKIYDCSSGLHKFSLTGNSNSLDLAVVCR
jgi:hypothetical protein